MDISPNNIQNHDLSQLVSSIFAEEYEKKKMRKLCKAKVNSHSQLQVQTETPIRIFEALSEFVLMHNIRN
jgi:hypothetical protein